MGYTFYEYLYATVAYADIFGYPLLLKEVRHWFISQKPAKISSTTRKGGVVRKRGFFMLAGRTSLVEVRKERSVASKLKWDVASNAARVLLRIPTVRLVGVTGALAMNNAAQDDDIDFFVVTTKGALWVTRGVATLILDFLGKRRKPGDVSVRDKICLNMFMSEDDLAVDKKRWDLFSAHEVLQMKPLWQRGAVYRNFLHANKWVARFLPNAWATASRASFGIPTRGDSALPLVWVLRMFEVPSKLLQLWYMKRRMTKEIITNSLLQFHPQDAREWVRKEFEARMRRAGIPLDNIFSDR